MHRATQEGAVRAAGAHDDRKARTHDDIATDDHFGQIEITAQLSTGCSAVGANLAVVNW
jgi:hypothetical protein